MLHSSVLLGDTWHCGGHTGRSAVPLLGAGGLCTLHEQLGQRWPQPAGCFELSCKVPSGPSSALSAAGSLPSGSISAHGTDAPAATVRGPRL